MSIYLKIEINKCLINKSIKANIIGAESVETIERRIVLTSNSLSSFLFNQGLVSSRMLLSSVCGSPTHELNPKEAFLFGRGIQ